MVKLEDLTIPVITGPTASGKTSLSIKLAKKFNAEIISADSRQMVKEMNIGTAKVTPEEAEGIPHHFIDIIPPTDEIYNSYYFGLEARERIMEIRSRGKNVLIVGGSGLYIQSLVKGFFDDFVASDQEKLDYRKILEAKSLAECAKELELIDPECALKNKGNKQRIHRGLEVFHFTGKTMTELQKKHQDHYFFQPYYLGVWHEREVLYERVNQRVDIMINEGLIEEVEFLISKYGADLKKLQKTVGYKEIIDYLTAKCSLEEAVTELKKNTRHFAKKQLTWFKKYSDMHWLNNPYSEVEIFKTVEQYFS